MEGERKEEREGGKERKAVNEEGKKGSGEGRREIRESSLTKIES